MKLTTTTQVSVDGVMQGPGAPVAGVTEGPGAPVAGVAERGAFERSGWAHFDDEASSVMDEIFKRADAFVFGRRTYEIFAGSWATWDDPGDSPIWTALNTLPKYVALTTPFDPRWANTTVLSGDIAAAIRDLKAKAGGELQVHGSGALTRLAAGERPRRRDEFVHLPGDRRPGHAAVPRPRSGSSARPGGLACHPNGRDDPGLSPHRPPARCNRHANLEHVTSAQQGGPALEGCRHRGHPGEASP